MTFDDIPVTPLSQSEIEFAAFQWSKVGTRHGSEHVDILYLYEQARVTLVERPDYEMGPDEARAAPASNRVFIRSSLGERARRGDEVAIMDLAHEFGHVVFHRGPEMKARKVIGNKQERFIREEESAENQAWRFARALMMPLSVVQRTFSAEALAARCKVPLHHARQRLAEAATLAPKASLPLTSVAPRESAAEERATRHAKEAGERLRLWNKAERIPGDRTNSRLCSRRKWRVIWSEFNQMTECGWVVRDGKIVAWKDIENR